MTENRFKACQQKRAVEEESRLEQANYICIWKKSWKSENGSCPVLYDK